MILIIGASEISRFDQIRDYVREELGEEITIDSFPGRPLGNCIRVIQEQMTPETKIVLLWALTPLAWRRCKGSYESDFHYENNFISKFPKPYCFALYLSVLIYVSY
ncbi:UNVERIFIED_CONTAM: hypothetical protein RMT77_001740 [Armadillidium vulgare]